MDNPIFASEEHLAFSRGRNLVVDDVKCHVTKGYTIRGKHYDAVDNSRLIGGKHYDVISNVDVIGESKRDVKKNTQSLIKGKHLDDVRDESTENLCGAFGIYPKWIQWCAKPRSFLVVFCAMKILGGAEVAFFMGSTTSLEKHFHFSSKDIGYMILFSELGPIILTLILSFLGGRGNRPRWLALGGILVALGTFTVFSASLFYSPPTLSESGDLKDSRKFCAPEEAQAYRPLAPPPSSSSNSSARLATFSRLEVEEASCFLSNTFAFTLFFVGRTLKGVGGALHFTLGSSYIDDSIKKKDSPIYFAMTTALGFVGPLLGFSLSSFALSIYVIPGHSHGVLSNDPRWVGAWWIGPLLFSIFMFLFSFVMVLFPRKMKKKTEGNQDIENLLEGETRQISESLMEPMLVHKSGVPYDNLEQPKAKERNGGIRELRVALRRLLSNKVVIFLAGAEFFALMGAIGIFFWLPKYFEHHFRTSKADSAFYTGLSATSSVIVGVLVGGVWIHRFRPRARTVAIAVTASFALYLMALLGLMTISCDFNDDLPGTMAPDEKSVELYRGCSGGCRCSQKEFVPVCVRDGPMSLTYFSPCHAGCPDAQFQDTFRNCTCGSPLAKVTLGYCRETCSSFLLYNVFTIIIKFFLSIGTIGGILISMRCVAEEDKPLSLGLKATGGALATMLNPLVFGSQVDSACLVWEELCGERGSCWVYNLDDFRYKLHRMTCAMFAVSIIFMVQVVRHIGDLALMEDAPDFSRRRDWRPFQWATAPLLRSKRS